MKDTDKTKEQLINELEKLRQRISESDRSETECKLAKEKLRRSEERYRAIFEQAAESIVLVDLETGALVEFNDRAHENLGYTREEFQKLKISDLEAIESVEEVAKHIKKVTRERGDTFETKHRKKSEEIRNILASTRILSMDGKSFALSVWSDITERTQAEETLKQRTSECSERLKELNCLYGIDKISKIQGITIEEVLNRTVRLIPSSCQYPELTGSRITFENREYKSRNFKETEWMQKTDIILNNKKVGLLEVCYLEEKSESNEGPFLKEERNLINSVADHLENLITIKKGQDALAKSESKLQKQKSALEQKNIALREILAQIEIEKIRIKDDIETNANILIFPILEKLEIETANLKYINLLRHHLERITSSFGSKVTKRSAKLSPREIEVCSIIKEGARSKDISYLLNISCATVEKHRENIRHKLGISKETNLTSFLREL